MAAAEREGDSEVGAGFELTSAEQLRPFVKRYSSAGIYSPECHRLAEHFLQDDPRCNDPEMHKKLVASLATDVQRAVEDWFLVPPN